MLTCGQERYPPFTWIFFNNFQKCTFRNWPNQSSVEKVGCQTPLERTNSIQCVHYLSFCMCYYSPQSRGSETSFPGRGGHVSPPIKQESWATAKMTAWCALCVGALKIFESPWVRPQLLFLKFLMDFCFDRSYECAYKIRSFTYSWDNIGVLKKFAQALDMPTLPFLQNVKWAFVRMDPVNVPCKVYTNF